MRESALTICDVFVHLQLALRSRSFESKDFQGYRERWVEGVPHILQREGPPQFSGHACWNPVQSMLVDTLSMAGPVKQ